MKILAKNFLALFFTVALSDSFSEELETLLRESFRDKGQSSVERLVQDKVQNLCSAPRDAILDDLAMRDVREASMGGIVFPKRGNFLGDWRGGKKGASNGEGLQSTDDPSKPNGGNCYACHQLDPTEIAYGNLGPSLSNYGARGRSEPMLRYTWTKLWDTHAYNVCSHMPRFGAKGILTEKQLKDVMAYLFDPESPVNRKLQ